jgi:tRNA pseudouridine32 synthase/23S rRNA pseudouridine746 synthase/23S rRNA pseudouridine1911/1915/1917 synthase
VAVSSKGASGRRGRLRGIAILHEDAELIVLEKSAGILTQETYRRVGGQGVRGGEYCVESALTDWVRKGQSRSSRRVYLVHRLDRETSGVMMVAKTPEVQEYFRSQWGDVTEKTYLARVEGSMGAESGVFESLLVEEADMRVHSTRDETRGRLARTEWKVLRDGPRPLVEVALKTGRKNQIRVHFAEAGHPVVGDVKYGRAHGRPRLCLHAWRLKFIHPRTREALVFETAMPDFAER